MTISIKIYSFILLLSNPLKPTAMVYMIWPEMCGSGVWIGTTTIITKLWKEKQAPILKDQKKVTTPTTLILLKESSEADLFCAMTPIAQAIE